MSDKDDSSPPPLSSQTKKQRLENRRNSESSNVNSSSAAARRHPEAVPTNQPSQSAVASSSGDAAMGSRSAETPPLEEYSDRLWLWQETQIAECVIDNALNRVVESYFNILNELDEMDDTDSDLEMDEEEPDGLEESAILMAINEHGLQQNEEPSVPNHPVIAGSVGGGGDNVTQNAEDIFMDAAVSSAIQKKGLSSNR